MRDRLVILLWMVPIWASVPPLAAAEPVEQAARDVLLRRCLTCHAGADPEGGLALSDLASMQKGGESGPALHRRWQDSLLWVRVAAGEMPEDAPLPTHERATLQRWLEQGAPWTMGPLDPWAKSSPTRAGLDWWSLQPLQEVAVPIVTSQRRWSRNPIDAFVLSRLEEHGLTPSPQANVPVLLRRLTFDVTGLPPTTAQQQRAMRSGQGRALDRMVDELLASVTFGQAWARHWLDVVRFGESHGFEYNQPRNHAYPYRNWVIEALNQDLPYDEFVRWQVAGDALSPEDPRSLAALGFLVAGPHNTTKPSSDNMRKTMRHDELEDMVGTIGQTFLGLTVNCARCHDHKFDPITQQEYYQLVAAVVGIDHGEQELPDERASAAKEQLSRVREQLKQAREVKEPDPEQAARLKRLEAEERQLAEIRAPRVYTAMSSTPAEVKWLRRGDVTTPAEVVAPSGLRAINRRLASFTRAESDPERRRQLAEWLVGNDNPLLARVIVNRIWQHYFGQGLVRTPSDFGFNGDAPSHPLLLDFLSRELITNGWRLKPIHRMILTSATYRQASRQRAGAIAKDADNRWLWRQAPRRVTAEQLRDAMLAASGRLDLRHGGPGYRDVREYKYRGSHYYDPVTPMGNDAVRRTVYRFRPRGAKRTLLDTFDCPDPSAKAPQRAVTTTPLQALALWNNPFVRTAARAIAEDALKLTDDSISEVYRRLYAREPSAEERKEAGQFIDEHGLASLCRVLLNSNEFLYVR